MPLWPVNREMEEGVGGRERKEREKWRIGGTTAQGERDTEVDTDRRNGDGQKLGKEEIKGKFRVMHNFL